MFDTITLGPTELPLANIDIGLLAECLVFYRKVRVITGSVTFRGLVRACGAEELLELSDMGCLEISFRESMAGIITRQTNLGECHDLGFINSPHNRFSRTARAAADEECGGSGRKSNRIYDRFMKAVVKSEYEAEIVEGSYADLKNQRYLEMAAKEALSVLVPEFNLPDELLFRPSRVPGFGIRYATNIDFSEANEIYRRRVPAEHSSLTPAFLLSNIVSSEPEIVLAARAQSEIAVDPLKSKIVSSRMQEILQKSIQSRAKLDAFEEIIIDGSRAIRDAVNSGERSFKDVIELVQSAQKFKHWLGGMDEDAQPIKEYCKSVAATEWADRLPPKSLRFLVMTGVGIAAGMMMSPIGGAAATLGLSAADYFMLDRLLKGWRPNQFVEDSLKPFAK